MGHDQSAPTEALDLYVIDLENLHHIQRGILERLYTVNQAAYSDLKPPELTGNAFNHHLRHIMAQQFISTTASGDYQLTPKGRLLVDNVSLPTMRLKLRPVSGVMLVLRSNNHGLLLYRSNREPTRGLAGLPFGRLRLNENLATTLDRVIAKRRLDPRSLTQLHCTGQANVRYFDRGELVSHRLASVWAGEYSGPVVPDKTEHGHGFWSQHPGTEPLSLDEITALISQPDSRTVVEISAELPR